MRHIVAAVVALAVLMGLPAVLETPSSTAGIAAAAIGVLLLLVIAIRGVVLYVRSRKPRSYHDSVMPPVEPPKR